jgi:outer membrane protein TolC
MSLKQQISNRFWVVCVSAAIGVFGSGRELSAFGQAPVQQPAPVPQPPAPTAQQGAPATPGSVTRLSVDDAVRLALENNLGIQAERLGPQIGTLAVATARGVYAPFLISTTTTRKSTEPPGNFLTGTGDVITDDTFRTNAGMRQFVPWGGGSYQFTLDASRQTTNAFTNYNPQLGSNFAGSYTQPLLRNFKIDTFRQQVLTSQNNQVIADIQLREQITLTSYAVRFAYYDLVGAIEGLKVSQLSLDLARQSLKDNQTRVEVGTMAPIDIIEAQAEVASNEEAVIQSEARISTFQDRLRALVLSPSQTDFWTVRLEPSDAPTLTPVNIDIEAAVQNALANRTDIARQRKLNDNVDVNTRFYQNQRLPGLDLVATYNLIGLAGTQLEFDRTSTAFPPPILSQSQRRFTDALSDVFGNDFRTWSFQFQFSYPIGRSSADAALASNRLQRQQGDNDLRNLELQVVTAVRDSGRQVATNLKRVEATSKAREFAERRLEAEQKRMTVGLSSTFALFQAQRDLARQRQNELNAIIDYNRSIATFEAIQTAPVGGGGGGAR